MNDLIELRQLKRAKAVVELRSFHLAADKLHTVQPNVSNDVKKFQRAIDVQLVTITECRRVDLTRAGMALPLIVQEIFDTIDDGIGALRGIQDNEASTLRFGCGSMVDSNLFDAACDIHKELIPDCTILPMQEDAAHLIREVAAGELDAAIVTLPVDDKRLCVEGIRQDRMVVCLRADDPSALKSRVAVADIENRHLIVHHPQQHPAAHARLMELLEDAGIKIKGYVRASHPHDMQMLVKKKYGIALVREGAVRDPELTTRPITGLDWTLDTAFIYNREYHPKTIRAFVRLVKRRLSAVPRQQQLLSLAQAGVRSEFPPPHSRKPPRDGPIQLSLFAELRNSGIPGAPQAAA